MIMYIVIMMAQQKKVGEIRKIIVQPKMGGYSSKKMDTIHPLVMNGLPLAGVSIVRLPRMFTRGV